MRVRSFINPNLYTLRKSKSSRTAPECFLEKHTIYQQHTNKKKRHTGGQKNKGQQNIRQQAKATFVRNCAHVCMKYISILYTDNIANPSRDPIERIREASPPTILVCANARVCDYIVQTRQVSMSCTFEQKIRKQK